MMFLFFFNFKGATVEYEWKRIEFIFGQIRATKNLDTPKIVVIIEANYGWHVTSAFETRMSSKSFIKKYGTVEIMTDPDKVSGKGVSFGVRLDEVTKEGYHFRLNWYLRQNKLFIIDNLISGNDKIEEIFKEQLTFYRLKVVPSARPDLNGRRLVPTGKDGGRKDDLILAFQMALYWFPVYLRESRLG